MQDLGCFDKNYINRDRFGVETIDVFTPSFVYTNDDFPEYEVPANEEGRMDLIMDSLYGEYNFKHLDVILFLNDIDNPLSVKAGTVLKYPAQADLDTYRWSSDLDPVDRFDRTRRLSKPNKTSTVDKSRQYSLPPTVNRNPQPAVRNVNNSIVAGGF